MTYSRKSYKQEREATRGGKEQRRAKQARSKRKEERKKSDSGEEEGKRVEDKPNRGMIAELRETIKSRDRESKIREGRMRMVKHVKKKNMQAEEEEEKYGFLETYRGGMEEKKDVGEGLRQ